LFLWSGGRGGLVAGVVFGGLVVWWSGGLVVWWLVAGGWWLVVWCVVRAGAAF
jgi:hypothetical protein